MRSTKYVLASLLTMAVAACGDDGGGAPAAPSGLAAEALSGGAHLTWTDNADNEVEFMVMRKRDGVDTDFTTVATVPFDTEQYHDAPLTSGTTYRYAIMAMNDDGETMSAEISFTAP